MPQSTIAIVGGPAFSTPMATDIGEGIGLPVVSLQGGTTARAWLQTHLGTTALVVIDAEQPGDEARTLCGEMTRASRGLPVVVIGEGSAAEAIRSLDAGAVDHFARAGQRSELLARLRAHLRSRATSTDVEFAIGPFIFRPGRRALFNVQTQSRIMLTLKESRLLRQLHLADGKPVTSSDLMQSTWNPGETSVHTLHTHVYRLRNKLGIGHCGAPMLQTIRGGYVLTA